MDDKPITYHWIKDELEQALLEEDSCDCSDMEEMTEAGRRVVEDYSAIMLGMQLAGAKYSLWDLLRKNGKTKSRVDFMLYERRHNQWHRRLRRHLRRKTYPVRHPWQAFTSRVVEKYGPEEY